MKINLIKKLKKIRAVVFDGDGVIFTGRVFITKKGEIMKERSYIDGQGISLLRAAGLHVAFISGEKTGFLESLGEKLNNLSSAFSNQWPKIDVFSGYISEKKVEKIEEWLMKNKINWNECAGMGDDIGDLFFLKKVGFAACPKQAEKAVKKIVHYISNREGGNGAIRDLCDVLLKAKGVDCEHLNFK